MTAAPSLDLLAAADHCRAVAAEHADAVDRDARFPAEAIAALDDAGLLAATLPSALGGRGISPHEATLVARRLGRGCGATALIWSMHQGQLRTVAAAAPTGAAAELLANVVDRGGLIASVTSEVGHGGSLRTSTAAIARTADGQWALEKASPTISYAQHAAALLITARRSPDAAPDEQVAVFVSADEAQLEPRGSWDPLGMRGTCSPGWALSARCADEGILSPPFAELAPEMVAWSHLLWAASWLGIAEEAVARVRTLQRRRGASPALADLVRRIESLRALVETAARRCSDQLDGPSSAAWFNDLKVTASEEAGEIARGALRVGGMPAFQERSGVSVARHVRDLMAAPLMIANERLLETNGTYALVRG